MASFPTMSYVKLLMIAFLLSLVLTSGCDGCSGADRPLTTNADTAPIEAARQPNEVSSEPPAAGGGEPPIRRRGELRERTWTYPRTKVGPLSVVVAVPAEASETSRMPVLIALHGMGEALKRPADGARGWIDDYWLPRAVRRLHRAPLTETDLRGFVDEERLARINAGLAQRPFQGLIVVTPYTPRVISSDRSGRALRDFGDFIVDELLPRVARETPALGTPEATGIDGVSFGGRTALIVGLRHPGTFGVVAATQAACLPTEAPGLAAMAREARERNPRLKLRLLTSDRDGFLGANRAISAAWARAGVEHDLLVVPGPHSYEFNRGPGVIEMLLFHDWALRGDEAI